VTVTPEPSLENNQLVFFADLGLADRCSGLWCQTRQRPRYAHYTLAFSYATLPSIPPLRRSDRLATTSKRTQSEAAENGAKHRRASVRVSDSS
jgi:hypothetical protein